MNKLEKYVNAMIGPNPKEAGIAPEVQKAELQARLRRTQIFMGAFGLIGLVIIAYSTGLMT
ncbi:MAG: hypothetical protein AAFR55_04300 [Pseudomonadota bacterium]